MPREISDKNIIIPNPYPVPGTSLDTVRNKQTKKYAAYSKSNDKPSKKEIDYFIIQKAPTIVLDNPKTVIENITNEFKIKIFKNYIIIHTPWKINYRLSKFQADSSFKKNESIKFTTFLKRFTNKTRQIKWYGAISYNEYGALFHMSSDATNIYEKNDCSVKITLVTENGYNLESEENVRAVYSYLNEMKEHVMKSFIIVN